MKVQGSGGTTPGAKMNICAPFSDVSSPFNSPPFSSLSLRLIIFIHPSMHLMYFSEACLCALGRDNRLSPGLALGRKGHRGLNGGPSCPNQVCVCVFSFTGVCCVFILDMQQSLLGLSTDSPLDPVPPAMLCSLLSLFHLMTHTHTQARAFCLVA